MKLVINGEEKEIDIDVPNCYYRSDIFGKGDHKYQITILTTPLTINIDHMSRTHCSICGQPRVRIKKGLWLCPGMEGSPMHRFGPPAFLNGQLNFEEFLKEKNCTLNEYRNYKLINIRRKKLKQIEKRMKKYEISN